MGIVSGKPNFVFWMRFGTIGQWRFEISRPILPFTKIEERIFGRLPQTFTKAFAWADGKDASQSSQLGALLSLEHLLIAQNLRRDAKGDYWTHLSILQALIDLTFVRYEGASATSGIVYTSQPESYVEALVGKNFTYSPFEPCHILERGFFGTPASYRYVDGRNSFYLVDNNRKVRGVLRAEHFGTYTILERCAGSHVIPLIRRMPGRCWVAHIGLNDDVQVRTAQGMAVSWRANHWQIRDEGVVRSLLLQHGVIREVAELMARTLHGLSELRKGALVLFPDDDVRLPAPAAQIDTSAMAVLLSEQLQRTTIREVVQSSAIVPFLASDGLTVISRHGNILHFGQIIDLRGLTGGTGGGRTQAALAASEYGLAVKVSADGPISVFRKGVRLLTL